MGRESKWRREGAKWCEKIESFEWDDFWGNISEGGGGKQIWQIDWVLWNLQGPIRIFRTEIGRFL